MIKNSNCTKVAILKQIFILALSALTSILVPVSVYLCSEYRSLVVINVLVSALGII